MTDTNATTTPETPVPPRGFKIIHVNAFTTKKGKVIGPHTRIVRDRPHYTRGPYKKSKRDPVSHRRVKFTETGIEQPKPIKHTKVQPYPQHVYALQIYEQLNVPMALLLGMKQATPASQSESEFQTRAMINRALIAINEARVFIDRFTNPPKWADELPRRREWIPDEQQIKATEEFNRKYPNPK